MSKFKTKKFLKNSTPSKVKVFGAENKFSVSPGDSSLGGIRQSEMPTKKIPGEITLNKFYKGK